MTAFIIKMMYKTELAEAYGCKVAYMRAMLKTTRAHYRKANGNKDVFGEYSGRRLLTVNQVTMFIKHNGLPYSEATE